MTGGARPSRATTSGRAVDAAVALARTHGLRVEEPGGAERATLRGAASRLEPFLEAPEPTQTLHGDAHPGNLIATRNGLVWIDFEDVCLGPLEWDLASIGDTTAVMAHHRPDPVRLAQCTELRALQVALCLIALDDVFDDLDGWTDAVRSTVGSLARLPDSPA